jgi:ribosomal protein S18 acetylase RimI-like enzyme
MYKNTSRDISTLKGTGPLKISCDMTGMCHAVGYPILNVNSHTTLSYKYFITILFYHMDKLKLTFRKAQQIDIEYLLRLRKNTMNEHLINSGMTTNLENHTKRVKYQLDNAEIILLNDNKIGLFKVSECESNIEIIQIQIEPNYQNHGIGEQIIKLKIEDAISKNKHLKLSVLKSNKAKNLYDRLGFRIIEEKDFSYIMQYHHC